LPELYDFLPEMGATMLEANYSRFVIDMNRDPSGVSLYPGQNVTELCPTTTFNEEDVYLPGTAPSEEDIEKRVETYWRPYHASIVTELERIKAIHGYAVLWDAHSIRSHVSRFFDGTLPDFNIGTNAGQSCDDVYSNALMAVLKEARDYTSVLNGRFKGGYITREYADPSNHVHAVQLELSQQTYMDETYPFSYDEDKAARVKPVIRGCLEALLEAVKPQS
jgi:N-formylglutamate amidohydrolase